MLFRDFVTNQYSSDLLININSLETVTFLCNIVCFVFLYLFLLCYFPFHIICCYIIPSVLIPSNAGRKSIKCLLGDFEEIKIKLLHTGNFGM